MLKKMMVLLGILALCATAVQAQEQKESGLSLWLKDLQKKIAQVVPQKSLPITTGVAGVRGAKEDSKARLYWKGKKGEDPVSEEELAELRTALTLLEKGESVAARKELEELIAEHPDSALIPDAKKTLDMVKAEEK